MAVFRSLLFLLILLVVTPPYTLCVLFFWPLPHHVRLQSVVPWVSFTIWLVKHVLGIPYRLLGAENIPARPCVVLCKHQSAWETLMLQEVFKDTVFVWRKEIKYLPFFGWALAVTPMIETDRSASKSALKRLVDQGRDRLANGYTVIIFPEGTRSQPGSKNRYKGGGALLAVQTGTPVVPVALNSGEFWGPQRIVQNERHRHRQRRTRHRSDRAHGQRGAESRRDLDRSGDDPDQSASVWRCRMSANRSPQLKLKLDNSTPDPATRWHDGAALAFLGGSLRLVLGTQHQDALREGDTLDLPLPPQATPRQIQDRAEAWLRDEAKRLLLQVIEQKSALAGRRAPRLALSFAARGHWVDVQGSDSLRCNWRLIEQPMAVIEQAIVRAIAALPPEQGGFDLFGNSSITPAR